MSKPTLLLLVGCLFTACCGRRTTPSSSNGSSTRPTSKLRDEMKVESVGGNKYALDFDGSIETIEADGTDQPGNFGITLSVSVLGPGRTIITATWTLSQDGNTHLDSPIF